MLRLRLIGYRLDGSELGLIPKPTSFELALPLNDWASLRVSYSAKAARSAVFDEPLEIAVQYATDTSAWTEIPGARFILRDWEKNPADPRKQRTYTLPSSSLWTLEGALVWSKDLDADGNRTFLSANSGMVVKTLIQEYSARPGARPVPTDFDTVKDSAGQEWSKITPAGGLGYGAAQNVTDILISLAQQGMCDWRTNGRTLQVYNPDTAMARHNETVPGAVTLTMGRDIRDAPSRGTITDLVTHALVIYDQGKKIVEVTNPAAPLAWGRREVVIVQGGVTDEGTARALAQAALEQGSGQKVEYTRDLSFATATFLPIAHYMPGDYILAPDDTGALIPLRVRQITLSRDGRRGVTGNVVLNDRLLERSIREARRQAGIQGGSTMAGGSGIRPSPEGPDKRTPAPPGGLVVSSTAYTDVDGSPRGLMVVHWAAVSTATDGTAVEIDGYEVAIRPDVVGAPWGHSIRTPDLTAQMSALTVGEAWLCRVRAIGRYTTSPGQWCEPARIVVATDTTPPPIPVKPKVTTELGQIIVSVSGVAASGGTCMVDDFSHFEIAVSASPNASVVHGAMALPGTYVIDDVPYGEPRYIRVRAVDTSGNPKSASEGWSAEVSIAPTQLVSTDIAAGEIKAANVATAAIDGTKITDGAISTPKLVAGAVTTDKLVAGAITAEKIAALAVDADKLAANAVVADKIAAGAVTAVKVAARSITADRMLLTSADDLIADPFYDATGAWNAPEIAGGTGSGFVTDFVYPGARNSVKLTQRVKLASDMSIAAPTAIPTMRTPVTQGETYRCTGWFYTNGSASNAQFVATWVYFYNAAGNYCGEATALAISGSSMPVNSWQEIGGQVTIPAGVVYMSVRPAIVYPANTTPTSASWWIGATHAYRAASAELIVDGAVTANKVDAYAITAKHTITGALFQTTAAANRGFKIDGRTNAVYAYDGAGNRTLYIDGNNGSVELVGRFRTSVGANAVEMNAQSSVGARPGLTWYVDPSSQVQPNITAGTGGPGAGWNGAFVAMGSEQALNSSGRGELQIQPQGKGIFLGIVNGLAAGFGVNLDASTGVLDLRGMIAKNGYSSSMFYPFQTARMNYFGADVSIGCAPSYWGPRIPWYTTDALSTEIKTTSFNRTANGFTLRFSNGDGNVAFSGLMALVQQ